MFWVPNQKYTHSMISADVFSYIARVMVFVHTTLLCPYTCVCVLIAQGSRDSELLLGGNTLGLENCKNGRSFHGVRCDRSKTIHTRVSGVCLFVLMISGPI